MHSDSYFAIGSSHKVCQDYAVAGTNKAGDSCPVFAIVSDGCSSASNTDFGARFLSYQAIKSLRVFGELRIDWIAWEACDFEHKLDLDPDCLTATLLTLHKTKEGNLQVMAAGDGVIAARRRDGNIEYWVIEYDLSAPAYPCYLTDPQRMHRYLEQGGGGRTVSHYLNEELLDESTSTVVVDRNTYDEWEIIFDLDPDGYDLVAVLSDGVLTFQCPDPKYGNRPTHVPLLDVLGHLMSIKSNKGEFVTRRCRRFLIKECRKMGWTHYDDFSMAAIWCGDSDV